MNILILHLLGAAATLLFCAVTLVRPERRTFAMLAWMTVFQTVTGSLLSLRSGESAIAYCAKIGLYYFVITATMAYAVKRHGMPIRPLSVFVPLGSGALMVVATLVLMR
jgi:hypothetical protein